MEQEETFPLSEQEKREQLAKVLQSFPDKITEEQVGWPEGYKLYEALRNLPPDILNASGRFLYSDISTLKRGKYYLLGYNPGGKPAEQPTCLKDEIRQWFAKNDNAYLDEEWGKHSKGQADLQIHVKALLEAIGIKHRDVCASNCFFARSEIKAKLELYNDFSVHEAVIDIVKPDCIIAFGNEPEGTYDLVKDYLNLKQREGEEGKIYIGLDIHNGKSYQRYYHIAEGQYKDKKVKMVGLPHLSHFDQEKYPDVLKNIAEECRAVVTKL